MEDGQVSTKAGGVRSGDVAIISWGLVSASGRDSRIVTICGDGFAIIAEGVIGESSSLKTQVAISIETGAGDDVSGVGSAVRRMEIDDPETARAEGRFEDLRNRSGDSNRSGKLAKLD